MSFSSLCTFFLPCKSTNSFWSFWNSQSPVAVADDSPVAVGEASFKVARYSAEQRKERILKYRAKRTQRNFNKTIKVNYTYISLCQVYFYCKRTKEEKEEGDKAITKSKLKTFSSSIESVSELNASDENNWEKSTLSMQQYACRKTLADNRPRIRGRFARNDETGDVPKAASSATADDDDDEFWV